MLKKVICPWCGAEMRVIYYDYEDDRGYWQASMTCTQNSCGAHGPERRGNTKLQALSRARDSILNLNKPSHKPLALKEIFGKDVVLEIKGFDIVRQVSLPSMFKRIQTREVYTIDADLRTDIFEDTDYGKTWRCWKHWPTDEEREAATWETT
jgi:hypothetical protein